MANILLAEDDTFLAVMVSKELSKKHTVEIAGDGREALEKIRQQKPDIMILDLLMPNVDGFEVLETMQKEKIPSFPILVLSNLGQKEDVDRAMKGGAKEFLVKMRYTPGDVSEKVDQLLKPESK